MLTDGHREPRRCRVLVLGFGPFGDVLDNPSARLALGLRGSKLPGGGRVVGEAMAVTWQRAQEQTRGRAHALRADLVLGIGLARGRKSAAIERFGRRQVSPEVPDADGVRLAELHPAGPDILEAPYASAWAVSLGVPLSEDAGRYVCNAWIWYAVHERLPAAFLHIPDGGFPLARLRRGIRSMVRWWQKQPDIDIVGATAPRG